jgi:hypothetical protein
MWYKVDPLYGFTLEVAKNHIYVYLKTILFYENQLKTESFLLFSLIVADTSIKE